jgi:hypothetical protein
MQALQASGDTGGIEPGLADTLLQQTEMAAQRQEQLGCRRCCWWRAAAHADGASCAVPCRSCACCRTLKCQNRKRLKLPA